MTAEVRLSNGVGPSTGEGLVSMVVSHDVANVLHTVLHRWVGGPVDGPRAKVDELLDAFAKEGFAPDLTLQNPNKSFVYLTDGSDDEEQRAVTNALYEVLREAVL